MPLISVTAARQLAETRAVFARGPSWGSIRTVLNREEAENHAAGLNNFTDWIIFIKRNGEGKMVFEDGSALIWTETRNNEAAVCAYLAELARKGV